MPIAGATVVLRNFSPLIATTSDENGLFRLTEVPIGRLHIECSFLGYHTIVQENILLTSGRELVLEFELEEKTVDLDEFVVRAFTRKDKPVNPMAIISSRSFSLEETERYAGSYGDPARMAANYAGVVTGNDNRNDIVIRGNTSMGISWRLDGIEIANPSHYAALGTTGGPITILNTNLLRQSDFLSGAYPAQYSNALAGVFDLKLRQGNNEQREYWMQAGWNGLEAGAEGPLLKHKKASYIFAYRYSILDIFSIIGVDMELDPKYQDMNFKLNFPYDNGQVYLTGLGGLSAIKIFDEDKDPGEWLFDGAGENLTNSSSSGLIALSNLHFFSENWRLKSYMALSGSQVQTQIDTFSLADNRHGFTKAGEKSSEVRYSFSSTLNNIISAKSDVKGGYIYDIYDYSYNDSTFFNDAYVWDTRAQGRMSLLRLFAQYRYRPVQKMTLVGGINYQKLFLNNAASLEPRLGLRWDINSAHALSAGFGKHSQMQPRMLYFVQTQLPDGTYIQTNKNLGFSKSNHYVLGYDYLISNNLRLKTEAYYQNLYNIPVKESIGAYSTLNSGVEYFINREDSLVNKGSGRNYGVEMTFEKFFSRNYFFLITASLFESTFKGYDGVERPSAFNSNVLLNIVGGYELPIGKKKAGALIFGGRFTWNGGRPYVPFDVDGTLKSGQETLDWHNAYKYRREPYKRFSLRLGMRRNKARYTTELTVDLQYRTHYTTIYTERIDVNTGRVKNYEKMQFYPISTWRLSF